MPIIHPLDLRDSHVHFDDLLYNFLKFILVELFWILKSWEVQLFRDKEVEFD